ncbi:Multidrug And Toxin Extrusion Protein 2 [Manis pentadactyla]|nr:Multidrug And Toxin Extrusion Protein 2 [Manis pentadactyla]
MGARSTWLPDSGTGCLDGPKQATATQTPGLRTAHPSQMQPVDTLEFVLASQTIAELFPWRHQTNSDLQNQNGNKTASRINRSCGTWSQKAN